MFAHELIYLPSREEQFRFKSMRFDERRTNQGTIKNIFWFLFQFEGNLSALQVLRVQFIFGMKIAYLLTLDTYYVCSVEDPRERSC